MIAKKLWYLTLFFCCSQIVACSNDKAPPQAEVIHIKGDPLAFVKGAEMDASRGLPVSLFKSDQEWQIYMLAFQAEEQIEIENQQQAEESEKPLDASDTEGGVSEINTYSMDSSLFLDQQTNKVSLHSNQKQGFFLNFSRRQDHLFFESLQNYQDTSLVDDSNTVLHYSVAENNQAFSILMNSPWYPHPKKGFRSRYLVAFYFIERKTENPLTQLVSQTYQYLFGPGVKVTHPQNKPTEITVCENVGASQLYSNLSHDAVKEWQGHLAGRLAMSTESKASCPPFSDLNTKVITHITDWVEVMGPRMAAAATVTVPDFFQSELVDSDIFVYEHEWNEAFPNKEYVMSDTLFYLNSEVRSAYKWTMVHELGHFLGLHHIFDGTPSVMSYSDEKQLHAYDIEAVQKLYDEVESESL